MNNLYLIIKHEETDVSGFWYVITEDNKTILQIKTIPASAKWLYANEYPPSDEFAPCFDVDWSLENGSVSNLIFNLEKAKEIFINRIRTTRDTLFTTLDVQFMIALENGNQTEIQLVTTKKQQLRDATNIDLSNVVTLDELKSKWSNEILGNNPYQYI